MKPTNSNEDGSTIETRPKRNERKKSVEMAGPEGDGNVRVEELIEVEVEKLMKNCRLLDHEGQVLGSPQASMDESEKMIVPLFDRSEVQTCSLLGNGAFSEVYQIWGFRSPQHEPSEDPETSEQDDAREALRCTAIDEQGRCRYVLKHLRQDIRTIKNHASFLHAASDLVMEALFLAKLDHPNIIQLRGTCRNGFDSFRDGTHDGFFLILDFLDQTLASRIHMWSRDRVQRQNVYSTNLHDYAEKVSISLQIARALDYLHDRDIIYRDLKPDNIGFQGNTVKLFDFGLCRELPEECPVEDKLFHMSGVGTRRYMSPETLLTQRYNLKADVYSFAVVMYTLLSLRRPFETYNAGLHTLLVCKEGVRPQIQHEWPDEMQEILKSGWAHKPSDRPPMKAARQKLERLSQRIENTPHVVVPTFLESSLQLMDDVTRSLCDESHLLTKQAGDVLKLLEGGFKFGKGDARAFADTPRRQHVRSQYL